MLTLARARSAPLLLVLAVAGCGGDDGLGTASETGASDGGETTGGATATDAASGATQSTSGATDSTSGPTSSTSGPTDSTDSLTGATDSLTDATSAGATDGTDGTDSTDGTGGTDDTGATTGALEEPLGAEAPLWLRALDGLSSLAPPRLAPLPDGDLVALVTGGLYAHEIVLADDDPDELVLAAMYTAPAFARFDGQTGELAEGRMLATLGQQAPFGMSVLPRQLTTASNGDLLIAGTWTGTTEFFPGTADAATHVTEMKLDGNQFHRAEDPFLIRMTPAGDVAWFVRGRTPPVLTDTWFNYGKAVAPLPDGGVIFAGDYDYSGFIAASNTGGAKTMSGGQDSYFARLDADGEPSWIYRNTAKLPFTQLLAGADGAVYSQLPANSTVFADADAPLETGVEAELGTSVVGRLDTDGGVLWRARVAKEGSPPLRGFEQTADGDLLLYGNGVGALLLRDGDDAVTELTLDEDQAWVAGLSAEGEALWFHALGPTVSVFGPSLVDDDGVWLVARVYTPFELEVAGETMPLPPADHEYEFNDAVTVLLQIDASGELARAQLLGNNLPVSAIAWSTPEKTGFSLIGAYWCDTSAQPAVLAEDGASFEALKHGCEMDPDDQRGYVAAIPRAL